MRGGGAHSRLKARSIGFLLIAIVLWLSPLSGLANAFAQDDRAASDIAAMQSEADAAAETADPGEAAALQRAEAEEMRVAAEAERRSLLSATRVQLRAAREAVDAEAARIENETAAIELIETQALVWPRKVTAVAASPGAEASADALYGELIAALRTTRSELSDALSGSGPGERIAIAVPPVDPALMSGEAGERLAEYQQALLRRVGQLDRIESTLVAKRRDALYRSMQTMNHARLALLPSLSSGLRSRVTGFGEEGLDQVKREVKQIALTLRYNLATGFADLKAFARDLMEFRAGHLLLIFQILLIVVVFRFWRGVGGSVLADMERTQRAHKPQTFLSSLLAYLFGLIRHALRPLDWLALLLVLNWFFPAFFAPAPIRLLWLIACWIFAGAALVQVIDAMARAGQEEDPRAALRKRSLRLVASVIIGVGLILTVTASLVGKGAIYSWLLTFCWLLAIPVLFIITTWWGDRIETLARLGAPRNAVLAWVSRNPDGIGGALGRVAAGFVLMAQGARVVIARRIRQLSLIREILGQRAREKASERVTADEESGRYVALSEDELALLAPHGRPVAEGLVVAGEAAEAAPLPGHVMAVVGDRGHGKTTVLKRLAAKSDLPCLYLEADGGDDDLLAALSQGLGCAGEARSIIDALQARPHCIAIDDVQRMIVPSIGGLGRFDAILEIARNTKGSTCWIFAVGGAAWPFLERARGDRPLFDDEIRLHAWPVERIRALIERRSATAGIDPEFEYAADDTGTLLFEEEIAPEERARRAFYASLTEESGGNPAVALERWRRSLFRDRETGRVCVRTFKAPAITRLAAMPPITMFVLRTILQMDIARFDDIARATDLPPARVRETLRSCELLGVVEPHGEGYRIRLYWFNEVRRMLLAQNLIVGVLP